MMLRPFFISLLLAGAGLLPHVAAGVSFLLVLLLTLLQLSATAPVYGWVDVLIAAAAALVVALGALGYLLSQ